MPSGCVHGGMPLTVFAALTVAIAVVSCSGEEPVGTPPAPVVESEPEPVPFALPEAGTPFATSTVDELVVHAAPDTSSEIVERLEPWSYYGLPRTVMILDHAHDGAHDWLEVLLPVQPNDTTGWIRAADVDVDSTTTEVNIYLDERRLTLHDDGELIVEHAVVIGHPDTPTPPGIYYVTDPVDLQINPTSVYGAYAIGLSGFSEVLDSFDGGPPQLAIHGTPNPEQMGQDISNGCIRLPDEVVLAVAEHVELGTPVHIHP